MNGSSRQKINKDFNNTVSYADSIDIHRTAHPTEAEYIFFSTTQ
jgi:hypothetical protein